MSQVGGTGINKLTNQPIVSPVLSIFIDVQYTRLSSALLRHLLLEGYLISRQN
jgi:hypothetical protein